MLRNVITAALIGWTICPHGARAAEPMLAATPPMGWNSWNHFATRIDDATVRAQADAMVASGMRDAGYRYINIDDAWEGARDPQGNITTNAKFPDMRKLADYVHAKGLKLGIYSSPGPKTCAGYPGSYQHEEQDARIYAAWGIDYLKYDLCSYEAILRGTAGPAEAERLMRAAYESMHQALLKTGRPILFNLCQYGLRSVWRWGPEVGGNSWRTTGDINDSYDRMSEIGFEQAGLSKFAGPGHWNDPDMLEVGNGGMTQGEYRMHISLWAILAAPLIAGNDLTTMTAETRAILTNRDIIAIDQDSAGRAGDRVRAEGPIELWSRPLADGSKAIAIFNRFDGVQSVHFAFREFGLAGDVDVYDVWQARRMGVRRDGETIEVPGRGVVLLRAKER